MLSSPWSIRCELRKWLFTNCRDSTARSLPSPPHDKSLRTQFDALNNAFKLRHFNRLTEAMLGSAMGHCRLCPGANVRKLASLLRRLRVRWFRAGKDGGSDQDQQKHERLKTQDGLQTTAPRPKRRGAVLGTKIVRQRWLHSKAIESAQRGGSGHQCKPRRDATSPSRNMRHSAGSASTPTLRPSRLPTAKESIAATASTSGGRGKASGPSCNEDVTLAALRALPASGAGTAQCAKYILALSSL